MIWWMVVGVLVLIFLVTSFIKLEHDFKAIKAIILVLLIIVIAGSVYGWIKSDNSDTSSTGGIVGSVYSYFIWLGDAGMQVWDVTRSGISTVGNVIMSNNTKSSSSKNDGRR
jgi:hypothetical protein